MYRQWKVHFRLHFPDYRKMVDLVERSLQLHYDNKATELCCKSDKSLAKRSRHIDIKFLIIKDKIWNYIVFVDSDIIILNITNSLIKGLSPKVFLEHIAHMGMASHDDILI